MPSVPLRNREGKPREVTNDASEGPSSAAEPLHGNTHTSHMQSFFRKHVTLQAKYTYTHVDGVPHCLLGCSSLYTTKSAGPLNETAGTRPQPSSSGVAGLRGHRQVQIDFVRFS